MNRIQSITALGTFLLMFSSVAALAGRCPPASLHERFAHSDIVMTVRVDSVVSNRASVRVNYETVEVFKSTALPPRQLVTTTFSTTGFNFLAGETYLVFAGQEGMVSKCSTRVLLDDEASEAEAWIRELRRTLMESSLMMSPLVFSDDVNSCVLSGDARSTEDGDRVHHVLLSAPRGAGAGVYSVSVSSLGALEFPREVSVQVHASVPESGQASLLVDKTDSSGLRLRASKASLLSIAEGIRASLGDRSDRPVVLGIGTTSVEFPKSGYSIEAAEAFINCIK